MKQSREEKQKKQNGLNDDHPPLFSLKISDQFNCVLNEIERMCDPILSGHTSKISFILSHLSWFYVRGQPLTHSLAHSTLYM